MPWCAARILMCLSSFPVSVYYRSLPLSPPPSLQDCVFRIEEQLTAFQAATQAAQAEAEALHNEVEGLARGREAAVLEAKTGREELKRARKESIRMKDELDAERKAHGKLKREYEQLAALYKQHVQVRDSTCGTCRWERTYGIGAGCNQETVAQSEA